MALGWVSGKGDRIFASDILLLLEVQNNNLFEFQSIFEKGERVTNKLGLWYSRVMSDSALIKPFTSEQALNDLQAAGAVDEKNMAGIVQSREAFPDVIFGTYPNKKLKAQPDIFFGSCGLVVSRAVADVLHEAELGKTRLYPLSVCQHDRVTLVGGEYYLLALGEQKAAFVPERSNRVVPFGNVPDTWIKRGRKPEDFDFVVRDIALEGVDLWVDPRLRRSLFLSDRLVKSLRAAKVTRRFGLSKCEVVPT